MGRLIDADALLNEFNPDSDALIDNILARMRIAKQPTAYDIDKVVEELEKSKDKGSVTKTEMLITKACVDKAIEIVKQGGVSDLFESKNQTNADRIRHMSDEELADYIFGVSVHEKPCVLCSDDCDFCELTDEECKNRTLEWLQSEVE